MECEPCTSIISFDVNNKFHVFLSFRGPDVRNTFVGHLYTALSQAGLRVFLDSEELEKGKGIDSSLQTAIQTSDIRIPIFSKRYAESTWCLEEAARMCRSRGFIIPLFYDVEPCDVRYPQRNGGAYAKDFEKHYSRLDRHGDETIKEWKRALQQISGFSGWSLEAESGHEGRLVKAVVKGVLDVLKKRVPLHVPTHLVGLENDICELENSLHLESTDIRLVRVGIKGIGGVGKTTLAKVVYNEIHRRFDASCFLFNIGATTQNNTKLMDLQRRILGSLVNYQGEVSSVDEGRSLMRDRLGGVRALVILDDVNDRRHLLALYGDGDWFGHGSRVIITSRDQHILNLAKVEPVFEMSGLGENEALELFSWHAFCRALPETPYKDLSTKVVRACRGNPLALQVIGSHLSDKEVPNDIQCWEEVVHNIGEYPEISTILQTSYDGLSHVEKEMFLDIAICLVGETKSHAALFWKVLYPNKVQTAIKNLSLKMLIGPYDPLHMHDLLREMGRGIEEQSDNNTRLRLPVGAHRALNRERAERMKMLVYTGQNENEPVVMHNMPSLRYLFLQNAKVAVNIVKLTPNLIWIKIRNCEIVSDRHTWMMSRNKLQLDDSWSQVRILSLERCAFPTKTPNMLNSLVNIQYLYIQHCDALTTLPSTVGNLSQLKELQLCGCKSLTSLPDTLGNLVQLEELCLNGCADLKSLPSSLGNLVQLQTLNLGHCSGLRILPNTIGGLAQLKELNLSHCSGLRTLPNTIGDLAQLKIFTLYHCSSLQRLPDTVGKLRKLKWLNFDRCSGLGSSHHIVTKLAQLRESNRSAGLGSLVQKEFNVYLGFSEAEGSVETLKEVNTLIDNLQRSVRICTRGREDDRSLCTESLRIYRSRDDDNSWAIHNSDILVPVLPSNSLSDWWQSDLYAMHNSNGLVIPIVLPGNAVVFAESISC